MSFENIYKNPMNERFKNQVAAEVIEYAKKYNCTLADSLADWEGDGPNGSWGLTPDEKAEVSRYLHQLGFEDIDATVIDCDNSSTEDAGVEDLAFLDNEQCS